MSVGLWLFAGAFVWLAALAIVLALLYAHGEREAEREATQAAVEAEP